jgi:gliding motility-associated-like protein
LNWEPYSTWNVGVDYYNIYRGTNDNSGNIVFGLLEIVPATDTAYVDQFLPSAVGENGLCYYAEAVQRDGDINQGVETCLSTTACVVGELRVFIPNAFSPNGVNTVFRPEGSYIDYNRSVLTIYDRWGKHITTINGIRNGWDGKDSDGVLCSQGVYLYQLLILSTNGQTQTFKGTVTLLN